MPIPEVPFVHARRIGELFDCHGAFLMQCLIQSQSIAHLHESDAYRTAQIVQHLADELMKFRVVNHVHPPCQNVSYMWQRRRYIML